MFLKAIELMAMILTDTHLAEPITQWRAERGGADGVMAPANYFRMHPIKERN
jgi:hypothetical protein